MNDGADQDSGMDLQQASAIIQETSDRARRALVVRRPVLLAVWGAAWVVSDGVIWLSVRGQRPYNGPTPAALLTLTMVIAAATVFAVIYIGRAGSGDQEFALISNPVQFDGQPVGYLPLAPGVGEHGDDVLVASGYSEAEIRALREQGVVG